MNNKQLVTETLKRYGKLVAQTVQENAETLTGTELNAEDMFIPDFKTVVAKGNLLNKKVGLVCKTSAGRVVRLLQRYDSDVYKEEPEAYPALWGFVWSTDPAKAKPFIVISTAPYGVGECCTENGKIYKSKIEMNVFAPSVRPDDWEEVNV